MAVSGHYQWGFFQLTFVKQAHSTSEDNMGKLLKATAPPSVNSFKFTAILFIHFISMS